MSYVWDQRVCAKAPKRPAATSSLIAPAVLSKSLWGTADTKGTDMNLACPHELKAVHCAPGFSSLRRRMEAAPWSTAEGWTAWWVQALVTC